VLWCGLLSHTGGGRRGLQQTVGFGPVVLLSPLGNPMQLARESSFEKGCGNICR
jgi:hypothetical protein